MKPLVIIPTYNERENISIILKDIFDLNIEIDVLVVDDNSPDGTAKIVEEIQKTNHRVHLLNHPKKMGLGRAYLDAFKYVVETMPSFDVILTMDADFSHKPCYLPAMLKATENSDLTIGSRYTFGGGLQNWPLYRILLSRFANFYAQVITLLPLSDLTAGFHAFRVATLKRILRYPISAQGYAFLVEIKYLTHKEQLKITEVPIVFEDRTRGASKISKRVIFESILVPWRCLFDRFFDFYKPNKDI